MALTRLVLVLAVLSACGVRPAARAVDVTGEVQVLPAFPRVRCGAFDAPPPGERPSPGAPLPATVKARLQDLVPGLEQALVDRREDALAQTLCAMREATGAFLGVPDAVASYRPTSSRAVDLSAGLAATEQTVLSQLGREPWRTQPSTSGLDVHRPLRDVCELVRAEALSIALLPQRRAQIEASLRPGVDWLLAVQRPDGLFPFPDLEDEFEADRVACQSTSGAARTECERTLAGDPARLVKGVKASIVARGGDLQQYFQDGWFVKDPLPLGNDGGLQYDNGICGEAMLVAGLVLDDARLLASARRSATWARAQVVAANWNYNAFSVRLMAWQAIVDGDRALGEAAMDKAWWGVLPGQLANGRWADGHNARVVYHVILAASLPPLAPFANERRTTVDSALTAALVSYADELSTAGGTAGDDRGLRAVLEAGAIRAAAEPELLGALRRNAFSDTSVRHPAGLDALLAEQGAHPLLDRLSAALR